MIFSLFLKILILQNNMALLTPPLPPTVPGGEQVMVYQRRALGNITGTVTNNLVRPSVPSAAGAGVVPGHGYPRPPPPSHPAAPPPVMAPAAPHYPRPHLVGHDTSFMCEYFFSFYCFFFFY